MSEFNPYEQPQADVVSHMPPTSLSVHAPVRVPFARGASWIAEAWTIFTRNGWLWIGGVLVLWVLQMAASMVPLLGSIVGVVLSPLIYAGAYMVAKKSDCGEEVRFEDFFAGFQTRAGMLAALGGVSLAMLVVILVIGFAVGWALLGGDALSTFQAMEQGSMNPADAADQGIKVLLVVLIIMALTIPYMALIWFAVPLLLFGEDMTLGQALRWSLVGSLKNILPMMLYGLLLMILMFVAMIPLMLGLLVLMPLVFITVYTSFRDIYVDARA
ncbi:MAG: hypothetical protein KDH99_03130 [Alcanivoracaceae bacterium]|nr:hypothetical protein [Alcanivoracaceae bacterium]